MTRPLLPLTIRRRSLGGEAVCAKSVAVSRIRVSAFTAVAVIMAATRAMAARVRMVMVVSDESGCGDVADGKRWPLFAARRRAAGHKWIGGAKGGLRSRSVGRADWGNARGSHYRSKRSW